MARWKAHRQNFKQLCGICRGIVYRNEQEMCSAAWPVDSIEVSAGEFPCRSDL